jgi:hypothetical protein
MVMRWHILRTLLHKEVLRHLANRGGIVLVLLLIVASMLLSFFGNREGGAGAFAAGVQRCCVDYWKDGPLVQHLRRTLPAELADSVRFRPAGRVPTGADGTILYAQATGAIQLRPLPDAPDGPGFLVWFWHPGKDGGAIAPYEAWFWKETLTFFREAQQTTLRERTDPDGREELLLPPVQVWHSELKGGLDPRSGLATALVLFGMFFVCIYLLPSLTCEERERGVLLAQALSPAAPREILAAKFLFYPVLGLGLAVILAGTYRPAVLARPFFWLALAVSVVGAMGIGLTIASVARTQRAASMGAMCYMLAVALLLSICQQNNIPGLPHLALEYHGPRMIHAALTDAVLSYHWLHLLIAAGLAAAWTTAAVIVFARQGWQ